MGNETESATASSGMPNPELLVGLRVRQLRQALGWSQEQVAKRLLEFGVSMHQTTIAKIEAAARPIRVNEAYVLAKILNVSLEDLLQYTPDGAEDELQLALAFSAQAHQQAVDAATRAMELAELQAEAQKAHLQAVRVQTSAEQRLAELRELYSRGGARG